MTLNATWVPLRAALTPLAPTAPAMMMLGVTLMLRVRSLRSHGATFQFKAPSLTICPAMVHTMPADVPERRSARAKRVPAMGARVWERRSWIAKREASEAPGSEEREEPATMRIALLTKRANVKREMASSKVEYVRQDLMAAREGR